mmetsp:Transcript_9389/g.22385  ORF Transcript_9389/g.22385 Transcript_9389/m.22385 type:complete len:519 (+) Transcript_9389:43-1599(+)
MAMAYWKVPEGGEDATVFALAQLLQWNGGSRPASAVGYIYREEGGSLHRWVVQSHGGVQNFVNAHPDVFALEPRKPGDSCPTIRLRSAEEQMASKLGLIPPCHYFQMGCCTKGAACKFSHSLSASRSRQEETLRMETLRLQVEYYLSDENLLTDNFFQDLIHSSDGGWIAVESFLGCPRIQQLRATATELIAALRWSKQLRLREWPQGKEAVCRTSPPPKPKVHATTVPVPAGEDALEVRPLALLRDFTAGWQAVVEDVDRRSFCFVKRTSAPEDVLRQEFDLLLSSGHWQTLTSKTGAVTRSTAWYVSPGCCCRYVYGDTAVLPRDKPPWLADVEARVLGELCGLRQDEWPNSVNMNLYEDESQNVGWHSDDEGLFRGCQADCRIISASWGASRRFEVAVKDRNHVSGKPSVFYDTLQSVTLNSGDLCTMEGLFQKHFSHQVAKGNSVESPKSSASTSSESMASPGETSRYGSARINLTWRYIVSHRSYCRRSRPDGDSPRLQPPQERLREAVIPSP